MYPFQRLMNGIQGYVGNKNRTNGYIIEFYMIEELGDLTMVKWRVQALYNMYNTYLIELVS